MHSPGLEHKHSSDLHFAHAVGKIDSEFGNQLCSLGWVAGVVGFHLFHAVQSATYQDESEWIQK